MLPSMFLFIAASVSTVSAINPNLIKNPSFQDSCDKKKSGFCISNQQDTKDLKPWVVIPCASVPASGCIENEFEGQVNLFREGTHVDMNPNGPSGISQTVLIPTGYSRGGLKAEVIDSNNKVIFETVSMASKKWDTATFSFESTACSSVRLVFTSQITGSCGPLLTNVRLTTVGKQDESLVCIEGNGQIPKTTTTTELSTTTTVGTTSTIAPTTEQASTTSASATSNAATSTISGFSSILIPTTNNDKLYTVPTPIPTNTKAVIVNPQSGKGQALQTWEKISSKIPSNHIPTLCTTTKPNHAIELTKQAIKAGNLIIIAIGGDGTLSEVVNGYILGNGKEQGVSIGILHCGTGGDFIKTVGIPSNPLEALNVVLSGKTLDADAGRLVSTQYGTFDSVERYFINIASIGLSANLIKKLDQAAQNHSETCTQSIDKLYLMAIANGKYFGNGMKVLRDADVTDGLFTCLIVQDPSNLEFVCVYGLVEPVNGEPDVWIEADGELAGVLPAQFSIVSKAVRIFVP
ncbi:ATP-NAD kinase-like domain-containing protein [Obelidium mucronatum]|nr:ATP-NAD kinase-like domain-containing protein [Obelidium mucronatum]